MFQIQGCGLLELSMTSKYDSRLRERMAAHYSHPKGFVGRSICYAVLFDGQYYGHIVGGSATKFLRGRNEYLGVVQTDLNHIVNNIFFNVSPQCSRYPMRNFTSKVVQLFMQRIACDWLGKYGDIVWGFETLVEKPRSGDLYIKAGWEKVGETVGYTCKRIAGTGSDSWTGKRVWNTDKTALRPKVVLCFNWRHK